MSASGNSPAWVFFTYASFAVSLGMVGIGIVMMPGDLSMKGFFTMGIVMVVQSCITMTKTMRDVHESTKLVNKLEEAETNRLLSGAGR